MTLSNRLGTFEASPGGEAGSPQGLTDEVEAIVHHHESVQNCYLRPHPSRFWRDTFPSREKALVCANRQPLPPLIRHGLRPVPPSPRGRQPSEGSAAFHKIQPYTPSVTFGGTSPYTPGGLRPAGGISIPRPADTNSRFPSASGAIFGTPGTPGGLRRKIGPNGSFPSGGTIHGPPHCPEPPADTSSACS